MFGKEVLSGDLNFMSLPDIFKILGVNNSTGVLHMTSPHDPSNGRIYFINGSPINAANGSLRGLEAIYALFGWCEGIFEFHEGDVEINRSVKNNPMQIVKNALKMLDSGLIQKKKPLPGKNRNISKGKEPRETVIKGPSIDYSYVIDEQEYPEGGRIITEGNYGKWIWIILDGMVKISRETPHGTLNIARLGDGSFIGTINSFLFKEYIRNATVTAEMNTHLGLLDSQRLSEEFSSLTPDFRKLLLSLAGRMKKISDRVVDFSMKNNTPMEIAQLGRVIIERGSFLKEVYAVDRGEAFVVGNFSDNNVILMPIRRAEVFGYLPFMEMGHEPFFASIMGSRNIELTKLDAGSLQDQYNNLSGTFKNMIANMSASISGTTRLARKLYHEIF